jgi:hypothetical protein
MKNVIASIVIFSLTATSVSAAPRSTQAEKSEFCNIDGGENLAVKTYNIMAKSTLDYDAKQMKEADRTYYHYVNACNDNSSLKTTKNYYFRFVNAVDAAWNSIH